uniref:BPTI/Kunitz inhibitor domain-containing protein n=1 Tax=Amblyomma maculatum TaxID=34609 RepID=G3MQ43_AMBMU
MVMQILRTVEFLLAIVSLCSAQGAEVCKLSLHEVRCNKPVLRSFFNVTSGFCESFRGCDGSGNNFATFKDCYDECENPCRTPLEGGRCSHGVNGRYYYNLKTGRCEVTQYGFCEGAWDSFLQLEACKTRCEDVCSRTLDPGPCNVNFPRLWPKWRRFYYDQEKDQCLPFYSYSGCKGNGNRFHTIAMCEQQCRRKSAYKNTSFLALKKPKPCVGKITPLAIITMHRSSPWECLYPIKSRNLTILG